MAATMPQATFRNPLLSDEARSYDPAMNANKDKIKGWIRERKYTINKDTSDAAFEWLLDVKDKSGFNFGVGQIKGHPEEIFFIGRYALDEHETKLKQLSPL